MVRTARVRADRGFTLIELMIAMALSTVGLLGLLALQMIAIHGNMMSRNFGEAIGVSQQLLETAQRTPYASLSTLADPSCSVSGYAVTGGTASVSPTADSEQAFYTRCAVVAVNGDGTTSLSVTTYWNDTVGVLHHVALFTTRSP